MQDVPGNGFCFLHALQSCLHDQGMPIRLDEIIVTIQNEIHKNFQHYMAFFSSEVNQQDRETTVLQYVIERHFNTNVDICIGAAANVLCISLYIFEMYNNGRVAATCYNSCRQISNTDVYLAYETNASRKKN